MKRSILTVILILCAFLGAYGQNSPIDLILVLDTSAGMSSSYETVNNYITGGFLSEFLRIGDTFHLIPFSSKPRIDVARRVQSRGDVETIIGRMLLQYPVESGNDIRAALNFAEGYVSGLPSRSKKIVLVSTGSPDANALVNAVKQRLGSENTLDFVLVTPGQPLSNLPQSGRTPRIAAAPAPTPAQTQSAPSTAPAASQAQTQPAVSSQPEASGVPASGVPAETTVPVTAGTDGIPSGSASGTAATTPEEDSSVPPTSAADLAQAEEAAPDIDTDTQEITAEVEEFVPAPVVTPVQTEVVEGPVVSERQKSFLDISNFSLPLLIAIIAGALLILGLIVFFVIRNLRGSPNRAMAMAAGPSSSADDREERFPDHSKDLANYAAGQNRQRTTPYSDRPVKKANGKPAVINPSGPLLLNLFVEDQNTSIGKRNIHSLKSGYNLSVGGGKSDFLVFLVPIPSNIGEIRRNAGQCTFVPKKPKYFPDLGSKELKDCINKTIRIVSDKNYELRFRFEQYEDPLLALNRMLNSLRVPG